MVGVGSVCEGQRPWEQKPLHCQQWIKCVPVLTPHVALFLPSLEMFVCIVTALFVDKLGVLDKRVGR